MTLSNYQRMMLLAEKVFDAKNDPDQLDVDEEVISRLLRLHPSSVSEFDDGQGPVAWLLVFPTTHDLMERFLHKEISEKELFDLTPENTVYDALYLCSALVLEEYRRQGITKRLALTAIKNIMEDHPLKSLFSWSFTKEGDAASETIARLASLPLYKR
jgi:hypothetical protein